MGGKSICAPYRENDGEARMNSVSWTYGYYCMFMLLMMPVAALLASRFSLAMGMGWIGQLLSIAAASGAMGVVAVLLLMRWQDQARRRLGSHDQASGKT
ncbi:NfeD family protein [Chromobacterium sp. IIBBL 290-4]|uniref:NfeD family protein n=1 Tax=Chromobacterium sp. IIBBL 290-4 TaxID=2953890 RepID=UPI0020B84C40|nr:hypothetical protein [Chromobacterium sp. IIBBL 290-4]UTH76290.1 hypothetical protein NKT35_09380 [Chromobacterium sp. IIBBL 290-4]